MNISTDEIRKLRRELERDLDALSRVESMLARRNSHPAPEGAGESDVPNTSGQTATAAWKLTPLTIEVIREAGQSGARASEVFKALVQRGYKFTSKEAGASSVATTLKRLVKQGKLRKADRLYTARP